MPTPTKGPRLGGSPAHQRMILANLATNLFEYGKITTTEAKARRLRPYAERLISKARRDDLHARRQVLSVIRNKGVVHTLFTEIAPRYTTRPGGYTRITKVGPRKGDNAPMAVIELVEEKEFATRSTTPAAQATGGGTASEPAPEPAPSEEAASPSDEETADSTQVEGDARDEEADATVGGATAAGADESDEVDDTDAGDASEEPKA